MIRIDLYARDLPGMVLCMESQGIDIHATDTDIICGVTRWFSRATGEIIAQYNPGTRYGWINRRYCNRLPDVI